jgi:D-xylonolactonase
MSPASKPETVSIQRRDRRSSGTGLLRHHVSPAGKGRLYRLDTDGSLDVVLEGIGCSNGMAFTLDQKGFYYTDSFAHEIYLFDYNADDGAISKQRVFARFGESDGLPDGATLDAEGQLWSALWDGASIVRMNADGTIERRIALPVRKVSSLAFGGVDYSDLYITTAGGDTRDEDGELEGGLFHIRGHWRGVPGFLSPSRMIRNARTNL